jgi:hypothetical protein
MRRLRIMALRMKQKICRVGIMARRMKSRITGMGTTFFGSLGKNTIRW